MVISSKRAGQRGSEINTGDYWGFKGTWLELDVPCFDLFEYFQFQFDLSNSLERSKSLQNVQCDSVKFGKALPIQKKN